jgi:uncharacterized membrane protein YkvA (DUF1232 family)
MDKKKLISYFKSFTKKAEELLKNKEKTRTNIQNALKNATANKGALTAVWDKLHLLLSFAKDYSQGNYTHVPTGSIIAVFASLVYFVSPLDFIPDFIFGLGFIDDVYILTLVYKQVAKDLEKYKLWKERTKQIIHI